MSNAPPLAKGHVLADQYEIHGVLGRGGGAVVYSATDTSLDRPVAIKVLARELSRQPEFVARFFREARIMARFDHPHIVPIYAVSRIGDLHFIVMKRLEGEPLSSMLRERGQLPLPKAIDVVIQLCDALAHFHRNGYVHRDVKPSNIFIDARGHTTLLDMGISRQVGNAMTRPMVMVGTLQYMAPEQALSPSDVDHRVDIYALGLVFFELLTGTPAVALSDSQMAMVRAHLETPLMESKAAAKMSPSVGAVLRKAAARHRDERYATMHEFKSALLSLLQPSDALATIQVAPLGDRTLRLTEARTTDAVPAMERIQVDVDLSKTPPAMYAQTKASPKPFPKPPRFDAHETLPVSAGPYVGPLPKVQHQAAERITEPSHPQLVPVKSVPVVVAPVVAPPVVGQEEAPRTQPFPPLQRSPTRLIAVLVLLLVLAIVGLVVGFQ
jgi:eukaryotic-like serine/threonine-protein kinase